MRLRALVLIFILSAAKAALVDRIAVVVGRVPILDSDIVRDIRVTAFLNRQSPDFAVTSRKQAASRLIDQELIRQQIRLGGFPVASQQETTQLLKQIENDRGAHLSASLEQDGVSKAELRDRLAWQLTVLRFIDTMFRPQVIVSDADIEQYYQSHRGQFDSLDRFLRHALPSKRLSRGKKSTPYSIAGWIRLASRHESFSWRSLSRDFQKSDYPSRFELDDGARPLGYRGHSRGAFGVSKTMSANA